MQFLANMLGLSTTGDPTILTGEFLDEELALEEARKTRDTTSFFSLYYVKIYIAVTMGRFDKAEQLYYDSRKVIDFKMMVLSTQAHWNFLVAFLMAVQLRKGTRRRQKLRCLKKCLEQLRKFDRTSPENNMHRIHLAEAEFALTNANYTEACVLYQRHKSAG